MELNQYNILGLETVHLIKEHKQRFGYLPNSLNDLRSINEVKLAQILEKLPEVNYYVVDNSNFNLAITEGVLYSQILSYNGGCKCFELSD